VLNGHFTANYIETLHKNWGSYFYFEVLVCLNLNWIKIHIIILVMPENESFQSGYFSKIEIEKSAT
jgi:hypothetical protein